MNGQGVRGLIMGIAVVMPQLCRARVQQAQQGRSRAQTIQLITCSRKQLAAAAAVAAFVAREQPFP